MEIGKWLGLYSDLDRTKVKHTTQLAQKMKS